MPFQPPTRFNIAHYFLDARLEEGRGDRTAILTEDGALTYAQVQERSNRYANVLRDMGIEAERRVIVSLEDGPEFACALFGILKVGAVVVMLNPQLKRDEVEYFLNYTRAAFAFVDSTSRKEFEHAEPVLQHLRALAVVDDPEFVARMERESPEQENYPTHRDDAAIWLFSGGTTGRPKAVLQTHRSFANTTERYGKSVLGMSEDDVTLSVPKLYFGYATGTNLRFRPTVLVNVPTMVNHMLADPDAGKRDLSSLRLATSAGEALPEELHRRWNKAFGVELLDGLGTAEMWHIFISNRPGDVRPGTLGRAVPGFEVRTTRAGRFRMERSGGCGYAAARARSATGSRWRRRRRPFAASGTSRETW
jgi:acyl-coenzyme A synthetase/AMP-(fatty) acid ligase